MNRKENANELAKARKQVEVLFGLYSKDELEECLFDVFQDATLFSELDDQEREKRAMLHHTLRMAVRQNLFTETIKQPLCITEIE